MPVHEPLQDSLEDRLFLERLRHSNFGPTVIGPDTVSHESVKAVADGECAVEWSRGAVHYATVCVVDYEQAGGDGVATGR